MRGVIVALCGLLVTHVAYAEVDDPVPGGISWYCYTATNDYDLRDSSGRCFRTEEGCTRSVANREPDKIGSSTITDCRQQKNASVTTYFDVTNDEMRSWALPSTALCQGPVGGPRYQACVGVQTGRSEGASSGKVRPSSGEGRHNLELHIRTEAVQRVLTLAV